MKDSFVFYQKDEKILDMLDEHGRCEVLRALFSYARDRSLPSLQDNAQCIVFEAIRGHIDEDNARYEHRCKVNKECVEKRWSKKETKEPENDTNVYERIQSNDSYTIDTERKGKERKGKERKGFSFIEEQQQNIPTLDEVKAYCKSKSNGVDPEKWYSYYKAKDWKLGKYTMVDWKSCIDYWASNEKKGTGFNDFEHRQDYDMEELARRLGFGE